jgi:pimeloyl-ACP methyl ester carboxylesterase
VTLDVERAKTTVRLALYAYRSQEEAKAATESLGLTEFSWHTNHSTQAFIAKGDDVVYLAFRGTEADNPIDWITDAKFAPAVGAFGASVHSGFSRGLDEVWSDVVSIVKAASAPVVLTGHSLGAALATLAAARFTEMGTPVGGLYTYGSPRCGLSQFKSELDQRTLEQSYRFINHIDLVTRVPLLTQGYRHVGNRVYFDAAGTPHINASAWRIAFEDVKFRFAHLGSLQAAGLEEHSIGAYVRLVDSLT